VRGVQDFQVARLKQPDPLHAVAKLCLRRTQFDLIIAADPLKLAEVGVSMAGNADVAWLSDVSGTLDVSDTLIESPVVCPFEHDVGELKPGHFKSTQHCPAAMPCLTGRKLRTCFDDSFLRRLRSLSELAFS
jgi:hypothetical protein